MDKVPELAREVFPGDKQFSLRRGFIKGYRQALENVRKEIERLKARYENDDYISTHSCGKLDSYDEVLDFIDNLTK